MLSAKYFALICWLSILLLLILKVPIPANGIPGEKLSNIVSNINFDFGVVDGELPLEYKFAIDSTRKSLGISNIVTSCGCTVMNVKNGTFLSPGQPIIIKVSLNGKEYGKGSQTAKILFDDGSEYNISLGYTYYPLPFSVPKAVVFVSLDDKKEILCHWPGEDVIFENNPQGCGQWVIESNEVKGDKIKFIISLNQGFSEKVSEGKIPIHTSSKRKPLFEIPFLILH